MELELKRQKFLQMEKDTKEKHANRETDMRSKMVVALINSGKGGAEAKAFFESFFKSQQSPSQ